MYVIHITAREKEWEKKGNFQGNDVFFYIYIPRSALPCEILRKKNFFLFYIMDVRTYQNVRYKKQNYWDVLMNSKKRKIAIVREL